MQSAATAEKTGAAMTRSKATTRTLGPLLVAALIPLLLPLVQQPPPALANDLDNSSYSPNNETEGAATTSSDGLITSPLQETSVSDGHPTSTAIEQESTFTFLASVDTVTQSQSHESTSESAASTITVEHEPSTATAAPQVTSTLELSTKAATTVELTTKGSNGDDTKTSANGETPFSPHLSTSPVAESSPVEVTWTTTSKAEETLVPLETTDIIEGTTLNATVSTESSRADDQTDSQTSIDPVGTTESEQTKSETSNPSHVPVSTSAESQITKEEASTHTEALSIASSDSPTTAGWTTRGDSNETHHSTTAQSIASQELPISTSDGGATTAFPQRRLIHAAATYGVDYVNVTAANLTELFKESFTTALTLLLKIDRADIKILMVEPGSITVHFEVTVLSEGVEKVASDLTNKTDKLHAAFLSSVQNYSTVLTELLEAAGKPNITVHVMPGPSSAPVSGPTPTTTAPKTTDAAATSKSLTDGDIAGVAIGSVLGGLLLVAIVVCLCKKRSSGSKLDEIASEGFKARSIANYEMVAGPGA